MIEQAKKRAERWAEDAAFDAATRKEASRFVFGFEESCGSLAGPHVRDKDAVMACMLVSEMAQEAASRGSTLYEELQALYNRYGYMGTRLLSFDITGALPMNRMEQIMTAVRQSTPAALAGSAVAETRDYLQGIDGLPVSNVLSYTTEDGKKAIIRPSGTEPKIKVYLSALAPSADDAQKLLDGMEQEINGWIA